VFRVVLEPVTTGQHSSQATSYRFDCKYLLAILYHADKALHMDMVWTRQDHGPTEHILKSSEEWKDLSEKRSLKSSFISSTYKLLIRNTFVQ